MYHSIDFFYVDPIDEESEQTHVNTWDDWRMVASSRPSIALPEFKANNIEIAGTSGFIDISRVLTGSPLYWARSGSIEFIVLNQYNTPDAEHWVEVYHKISRFLHGRQVRMVLTDDEPNFYYIGTFTVDQWESGDYNSTITINYELQPYKWARRKSNEDWLWDPFDLEYGLILNEKYKGLKPKGKVSGSTAWDYTEVDISGYIGEAPVCPEVYFKVLDTTTEQVNMMIVFEFVDDLGIETSFGITAKHNQGQTSISFSSGDASFEVLTDIPGYSGYSGIRFVTGVMSGQTQATMTYYGDLDCMTADVSFREGRL